MIVKERLQTTIATYMFMIVRQVYLIPKASAVITSVFPDEVDIG